MLASWNLRYAHRPGFSLLLVLVSWILCCYCGGGLSSKMLSWGGREGGSPFEMLLECNILTCGEGQIPSLICAVPFQLLWDSVLLLFEFLYVFIQLRAQWLRMLQHALGKVVMVSSQLRAFINFFHSYFVLLFSVHMAVSLGTQLENQAVTGSQCISVFAGHLSLQHFKRNVSDRCKLRPAIVPPTPHPPPGVQQVASPHEWAGAREGGGMDQRGQEPRCTQVFLPCCGAADSDGSVWPLGKVRAVQGCPRFFGLASFLCVSTYVQDFQPKEIFEILRAASGANSNFQKPVCNLLTSCGGKITCHFNCKKKSLLEL